MKPFEISRSFPNPKNQVFEAWSQVQNFRKWWCPPEFSIHIKEFDFKKGGVFHYNISSLDGWPLWGKFVYGDIIENESIEFITSFSDENGNIVQAPFSDTWPLKVLVKILFNEISTHETQIHLTSSPIESNEEEELTYESNFENLKTGLSGTLNQLKIFLES